MGLLPCNSESVLLAALLLLCFALLCFVLLCLLSFAFLCFAYVAVLARLRLLSFALLALLASPAFAQRFQAPAAWGLRRHRKNGKHPQHNRDVSKTSPKRQQRAKREKNEGCHPPNPRRTQAGAQRGGGRHPILSINRRFQRVSFPENYWVPPLPVLHSGLDSATNWGWHPMFFSSLNRLQLSDVPWPVCNVTFSFGLEHHFG